MQDEGYEDGWYRNRCEVGGGNDVPGWLAGEDSKASSCGMNYNSSNGAASLAYLKGIFCRRINASSLMCFCVVKSQHQLS